MKYSDILNRVEKLDKENILLVSTLTKRGTRIEIYNNNKKVLNISYPQLNKLKELGYQSEIR